jgi:hypothetical protein
LSRAAVTLAPSASEPVIAWVTMYSALNWGRGLAFSDASKMSSISREENLRAWTLVLKRRA